MKKKFLFVPIGIIILAAAIIAVMIGNPRVYMNNQKLKKSILSIDSNSVSLNEVVPFDWDAVYTFDPYTSKKQMEEILGFKSNAIKETVNEGMVQLIFVKDQKVVSSICGYRESLGFYINFATSTNNYQKIAFEDNAVFTVKRTSGIIELTYTNGMFS